MSILNKLQKTFDSTKTFTFSEINPFNDVKSWIPSGSPSLDMALNILGYPTGVIEVRGESQSGKTTFSLQAMKNVVEGAGERAIVSILSSERRDNLPYAAEMGVPVSQIIVHRIKTIEDVKNKIFQTVRRTEDALTEAFEEEARDEGRKKRDEIDAYVKKRKEEFGKPHYLFVWDSLGQTVSGQELAKAEENADKDDIGQSALASGARSLGNALRSIKTLEDEHCITLFIINRPYDKTDGQPGKKSYGGKAIELFPTMRWELAKTKGLKVGEDEVGQITEVKVIKSDFGPPKVEFEVEIAYGLGIVLSKTDIEFGIECGLLTRFGQVGAEYKIKDKTILKWQTRSQLYELYRTQNPQLRMLIKMLNKEAHKRVVAEREKRLKELLGK